MDLTGYVLIFVCIMVVGLVVIFFLRRRAAKSRANLPVIVFQRTATGLAVANLAGKEVVENTQRMLDIPAINRKFNFPSPTTLIFGVAMYLQTDEITYRQLILKTDMENVSLKQIRDKMDNPLTETERFYLEQLETKMKENKKLTDAELVKYARLKEKPATSTENLTEAEREELFNYLKVLKLKPEIDPAFRHIYANNVEKIVKATTIEDTSMWAKISKLMPVIMIVATCVGLAILMYAYVPLFNAAIGHVTLSCTNAAAPANVSPTTTIGVPKI